MFASIAVIGPGPVGVIGSFLDWDDLRCASSTNHGYFTLLQQARVTQRITNDKKGRRVHCSYLGEHDCESTAEYFNTEFHNMQAIQQYYSTVESFDYQFLYGKVLQQTDQRIQASVMRGPVLEHLLTLCGTNVDLALNVVKNYTFLYQATSILSEGENDGHWLRDQGWLEHEPSLRWQEPSHSNANNGCWHFFDRIFAVEDFPLTASDYIQYLIEGCIPVFWKVQTSLSLRMRSAYGECELGECTGLLESMHMTTSREVFITHLQSLHMAAVTEHQREAAQRRPVWTVDDSTGRAYIVTDEDVDAHYMYLYEHVSPTEIYCEQGDRHWERTNV